MKRLYIFILALLASLASMAGDKVPAEQAYKKASDFFRQAPTRSGTGTLSLVKTASDNAFYVYNRDGGGFVIVSGDDSIGPYLAYSYENSFCTDDMPGNVRGYLSALESQVKRGVPRKLSVPQTRSSEYREKLLTTAKWSQHSPYNDLCPSYGGTKCPTGCVATAMAIVMRYKKWPQKGTGHVGDYNTSTLGIHIDGYDLGHTYDWDNMPLEPGQGCDEYQALQIATLMRDCGVIINTDYTCESSGSHSEYVLPALVKYMGYDAGNILRFRFRYTDTEWMTMIRESIDNDCPVLFAGETEGGGHEFVVDGYSGDDYVSMNFGWGGRNNGFYLLAEMGGFPLTNVALFNLKKDEGNSAISESLLLVKGDGLSLVDSYSEDSNYRIEVDELYNYGTDTFKGEVAIGLNDKDGNLQEIISNTGNLDFEPYTGYKDMIFSCSPAYIKSGRSVQLYFSPGHLGKWQKASFESARGVVGLLYPAGDQSDPEDEMILEYDRTTGILTITSSVTCSFSADGCWSTDSDGNMTVDTKKLSAGEYTITYNVNGQERTITLPIGNDTK